MIPRWKRHDLLLIGLVAWANWTVSAQEVSPRPNGSEQASVHQASGSYSPISSYCHGVTPGVSRDLWIGRCTTHAIAC